MIYIRVELWPLGNKARARLLGEATISNTGGDVRHGEYEANLSKTDGFASPQRVPEKLKALDPDIVRVAKPLKSSIWKSGNVKGFPRLTLGPWDLLYRALRTIVGSRNV